MGTVSDYCCDIHPDHLQIFYKNNNQHQNAQKTNHNKDNSSHISQSTIKSTDFQFVKFLCESQFGKITTVRLKQSNNDKLFAMKIIDKSKIKEEILLQSPYLQTGVALDDSPFVTKILYVFQNKTNIYIVMEYIPGQDLYYYLYQQAKNNKTFTQQTIRQIAAQTIFGLEFLHSKKLIYRELKPQNLLCTQDGHIKLTDYALSKIQKPNQPALTYLSTIQYMAPQMLDRSIGYNRSADIWSLGILLYELKFGCTPFKGLDQRDMIQKIRKGNIEFSQFQQISPDLKNLICQLSQPDPQQRPRLQQIKQHPFFNKIDWQQVFQRKNETGLVQIMKQYKLSQRGKDDNPPLRNYMQQQERQHIKTPYYQFTHPTAQTERIKGFKQD